MTAEEQKVIKKALDALGIAGRNLEVAHKWSPDTVGILTGMSQIDYTRGLLEALLGEWGGTNRPDDGAERAGGAVAGRSAQFWWAQTPREIAEALETAERMGAERDEPEGVRYIVISDTLARRWADVLRETPGRADGL